MKSRVSLVLAFIVLAPVFVAAQNQPSRAKKRNEAQQPPPPAPINVNCNCTKQTDDSKDKPQGWHKLVTWPEGIATLALIFTLGAIVWQAVETHRSTNAMRRNIALQFRPKLIVRKVELERSAEGNPVRIKYAVANTGGTDARILRIQGSVDYADVPGFWGNPSKGQRMTPPAYSQQIDSVKPTVLIAGEERHLTLELDPTIIEKIKFVEMRMKSNVTNPQLVGLISLLADIQYSDDVGIKRKTGIWRTLDIETSRFTAIEDAEYEYQD